MACYQRHQTWQRHGGVGQTAGGDVERHLFVSPRAFRAAASRTVRTLNTSLLHAFRHIVSCSHVPAPAYLLRIAPFRVFVPHSHAALCRIALPRRAFHNKHIVVVFGCLLLRRAAASARHKHHDANASQHTRNIIALALCLAAAASSAIAQHAPLACIAVFLFSARLYRWCSA